MRESGKAKRAFEDYFALGPGRSLAKLAKEYGGYQAKRGQLPPTTSLATLERWSSAFDWPRRAEARDAQIAAEQLEAIKASAPQTGYAVYQKRIADLNKLAEKL